MFDLLAQVAPGADAVQHLAPVPNDVPWTTIAAVIWVGAAVAAFGIQRRLRWVVDQLEGHAWLELATTIVAVVLCAAGGGIAGWRVWDPWLGATVAAAGALGSPWIVSWASKALSTRLGRRRSGTN